MTSLDHNSSNEEILLLQQLIDTHHMAADGNTNSLTNECFNWIVNDCITSEVDEIRTLAFIYLARLYERTPLVRWNEVKLGLLAEFGTAETCDNTGVPSFEAAISILYTLPDQELVSFLCTKDMLMIVKACCLARHYHIRSITFTTLVDLFLFRIWRLLNSSYKEIEGLILINNSPGHIYFESEVDCKRFKEDIHEFCIELIQCITAHVNNSNNSGGGGFPPPINPDITHIQQTIGGNGSYHSADYNGMYYYHMCFESCCHILGKLLYIFANSKQKVVKNMTLHQYVSSLVGTGVGDSDGAANMYGWNVAEDDWINVDLSIYENMVKSCLSILTCDLNNLMDTCCQIKGGSCIHFYSQLLLTFHNSIHVETSDNGGIIDIISQILINCEPKIYVNTSLAQQFITSQQFGGASGPAGPAANGSMNDVATVLALDHSHVTAGATHRPVRCVLIELIETWIKVGILNSLGSLIDAWCECNDSKEVLGNVVHHVTAFVALTSPHASDSEYRAVYNKSLCDCRKPYVQNVMDLVLKCVFHTVHNGCGSPSHYMEEYNSCVCLLLVLFKDVCMHSSDSASDTCALTGTNTNADINSVGNSFNNIVECLLCISPSNNPCGNEQTAPTFESGSKPENPGNMQCELIGSKYITELCCILVQYSNMRDCQYVLKHTLGSGADASASVMKGYQQLKHFHFIAYLLGKSLRVELKSDVQSETGEKSNNIETADVVVSSADMVTTTYARHFEEIVNKGAKHGSSDSDLENAVEIEYCKEMHLSKWSIANVASRYTVTKNWFVHLNWFIPRFVTAVHTILCCKMEEWFSNNVDTAGAGDSGANGCDEMQHNMDMLELSLSVLTSTHSCLSMPLVDTFASKVENGTISNGHHTVRHVSNRMSEAGSLSYVHLLEWVCKSVGILLQNTELEPDPDSEPDSGLGLSVGLGYGMELKAVYTIGLNLMKLLGMLWIKYELSDVRDASTVHGDIESGIISGYSTLKNLVKVYLFYYPKLSMGFWKLKKKLNLLGSECNSIGITNYEKAMLNCISARMLQLITVSHTTATATGTATGTATATGTGTGTSNAGFHRNGLLGKMPRQQRTNTKVILNEAGVKRIPEWIVLLQAHHHEIYRPPIYQEETEGPIDKDGTDGAGMTHAAPKMDHDAYLNVITLLICRLCGYDEKTNKCNCVENAYGNGFSAPGVGTVGSPMNRIHNRGTGAETQKRYIDYIVLSSIVGGFYEIFNRSKLNADTSTCVDSDCKHTNLHYSHFVQHMQQLVGGRNCRYSDNFINHTSIPKDSVPHMLNYIKSHNVASVEDRLFSMLVHGKDLRMVDMPVEYDRIIETSMGDSNCSDGCMSKMCLYTSLSTHNSSLNDLPGVYTSAVGIFGSRNLRSIKDSINVLACAEVYGIVQDVIDSHICSSKSTGTLGSGVSNDDIAETDSRLPLPTFERLGTNEWTELIMHRLYAESLDLNQSSIFFQQDTLLNWQCISGSSDLVTVYCRIQRPKPYSPLIQVQVRAYNSSGFKLPSLGVRCLLSIRNWNSTDCQSSNFSSPALGTDHDGSMIKYSCDYMLPNTYINHTFECNVHSSSEHTCGEKHHMFSVQIQMVYPDLQLEQFDVYGDGVRSADNDCLSVGTTSNLNNSEPMKVDCFVNCMPLHVPVYGSLYPYGLGAFHRSRSSMGTGEGLRGGIPKGVFYSVLNRSKYKHSGMLKVKTSSVYHQFMKGLNSSLVEQGYAISGSYTDMILNEVDALVAVDVEPLDADCEMFAGRENNPLPDTLDNEMEENSSSPTMKKSSNVGGITLSLHDVINIRNKINYGEAFDRIAADFPYACLVSSDITMNSDREVRFEEFQYVFHTYDGEELVLVMKLESAWRSKDAISKSKDLSDHKQDSKFLTGQWSGIIEMYSSNSMLVDMMLMPTELEQLIRVLSYGMLTTEE